MSLWRHRGPDAEAVERLRRRHARTLNGGELAAALSRLAADAGVPPIDPASVVAQPLILRRDRFIVIVDARSAAGPVALIAKGYTDERAAQAFANHRALWDAGLGADRDVDIGRPWGVIDSLGLVVTERFPGRHPSAGDLEGARLAARATARLHGCAARLAPRVELGVVLDNLERRMRLLAARAPDLERSPVELAQTARVLGDELGGQDARPVNGDLSRESFIIVDGRTHLIDWDLSCEFDPAWDVGHYLAQARRYELRHPVSTDQLRATFVEAYVDATAADAAFLRRVDYYEGIVCLHKAHTIGRYGAPVEHSAVLVDAAARALARAGA